MQAVFVFLKCSERRKQSPEHWSRERRLCGITDCDAYVILHGNNIADIKNLLKFVRLTRRLK